MPASPADFAALHESEAAYLARRAALAAKLDDGTVTLVTKPDGTDAAWVRLGSKVREVTVVDLRSRP